MQHPIAIIISLFFSLNILAQKKISPKIIDSKTNNPIAFANIKYDNSSKGVFSDIDGFFELNTKLYKSISISYIGYKDTTIITAALNNNTIIKLQKKAYNLSTVDILPGENPAFAIIRKVVDNKKLNDPQELENFSYTAYHKFIVTADADAIKQQMNAYKNPDSTLIKMDKFLSSQHILLSESVSKRNYEKPNKNKEEVIATRLSGLSNPQFSVLGSQLQSFSFYDASIDVLDKHYINPVSKSSLNKYFYQLVDSIYTENDTTYIISFRPHKGTHFDALKGQLHISSNKWAIKNISAEPAETSSDYGIQFQQKYELIDNKYWFPIQITSDLTFYNLIIEDIAAKGIARTYIRELKINNIPEKRVHFNNEVMIIAADAGKKHDDTYWKQYRPIELDSMEVKTYHTIDSLGKAEHLDEKLWAMMAFMNGRIPLGYVDMDIMKLFNYNEFEGFRLGLGLRTNDRLMKRADIGIYAGYGFRDYQWKYKGDININILPKSSLTLNLTYTMDVLESAEQYKFDITDFYGYERLRDFLVNEMVYYKGYSSELKFRALPNSSWSLGANYYQYNSISDYSYSSSDQESAADFLISEIGIGWRFAFKEKLYRTGNTVFSMGTNYPILNVHYTQAIPGIQDSELNYKKLDLQLDFNYDINFLGKQYWRIKAGRTIGDAPWYKLYNGNASYTQWYAEAPNTFGTMRYNEFLSDEYIAVYFRHDFKGLLFGSKPFVPQPVFVTSATIGNLSNAGYHKNINFNTLEKGYYESGLLLNSILRSGITNIGVGVFYRWGPYSMPIIEDNIAYKITIGYML